jgi:hypothetical protein
MYAPLRKLEQNCLDNLVKIQLRVANSHLDQSKLCANHHLSLHEVVDITHILKLAHQVSKIIGLGIPRKHGIVNHGQGIVAEVEESSSLGCSILKLNNTVSTIFVRPKINVIGLGKMKKGFNSRIYSLLFSGSIQKGTYEKQKGKAI